ncbi:MAG: transketolase family protein [Solirubrobacterales bacterium]
MEKIATRDAYGKALKALGGEHADVVVLDADLTKSTKTVDFAKAYPERFYNMGIAEQNMIAAAAGLATTGKVVFASSFAIFAVGRSYEIVRNAVAYARVNVKIAATHAGLTVGEDGGSHQSIEDIAIMRVLPNMKVIVPADAVTAEWAVKAAYETPGPVYLRLGRPSVPVIYEAGRKFELGKANLLREGTDVGIVACGMMVWEALQAADLLAEKGISAAVLDMHTIKPLDTEALEALARKTGCLVTAEEHSVIGGLGSAVAEAVSGTFPVLVTRLGVDDTFGQSGTPDELLRHYGLTAAHLAEIAEITIARKAKK